MRTGTIRQTVLLPAPPSAVYRALACSEGHSAFTGSTAKIPKRAGARMSAYDGYISGTVLGLWPGMGLLQTWRTTEWPEGAPDSRLEIRLAPAGKGTRLTMIHSEVPASQAARYRGGWKAFYWAPLKRYLKGRRRSDGRPCPPRSRATCR